jgi:NADPH:quinone reductase-like Zn-dependent oxidoreductase
MSQQKALLLESKQGPFFVSTIPKPTSAPAGELLVKVEAAGLNPVDWIIQQTGRFYSEYPVICGSDIAAEVVDVGEGVEGFKKGDRV